MYIIDRLHAQRVYTLQLCSLRTSNSSSPAFSLPSLIAAPLFKTFFMKNVRSLLVATSLLVTVNPKPSDPATEEWFNTI